MESAQGRDLKFAVLSMDVEDWYHTGYLSEAECRKDFSMLDGMDRFTEVLGRHQIPAQFFVLSDLLKLHPGRFRKLAEAGHEFGSHGRSHTPPLNMDIEKFRAELVHCREVHRQTLGREVEGFRAPRFLIDRSRLDVVHETGFTYDASVIQRNLHRHFDFQDFNPLAKHILSNGDFFEFRPANFKWGGVHWPVAGGGAMRILPWWVTRLLTGFLFRGLELYSFYTHPIDISRAPSPPIPTSVGSWNRWRMSWGRASMAGKLEKLIQTLEAHGFRFVTYSQLRRQLIAHQSPQLQSVELGTKVFANSR